VSPVPRMDSASNVTLMSSITTQRVVSSTLRATTASMMCLPAYATSTGTAALTSVSAAMASRSRGEERQTSASVRRV